jgi:hypothetical protein
VAAVAAVFLGAAGCGYYSFTGATIPQHLDSIAIPLVEDASTSPLLDLNSNMTQLLVDRFVGQTRLSLEPTESEADALLTVQIQRYVNQPAAVGGQERANLNRITITVMATYMDRVENRQLFERAFSASDEYDPQVSGFAGEEVAAANILENLADDIFTAATSNW